MGILRYYSEAKSYSAGRDLEFFDFVPREGPNGGRVVIDTFHVYCDAQVDVTAAAAQGEDLPKIVSRVEVVESDGRVRWRLNGEQTRVMAWLLNGAERYGELPDLGIGADQALLVHLPIPMAKPKIHTAEDFSLPADELRKVIVQAMVAGALNIGSSVVAIDTASYYVVAECHEEHDLQFHAKDCVKADLLTSLTEGVINVSGKIHDMVLHANGASGGASLANLTDVRIDEPAGMLQISKRTELVKEYGYKRASTLQSGATVGTALRSDPFLTNQACPVIVADHRVSCWEGRYADRVKINLTNSVASLSVLTRTVQPFNPEQRNQIASAYGLRTMEGVVVKTEKKSSRALAQWPKRLRPYLPVKASLAAK